MFTRVFYFLNLYLHMSLIIFVIVLTYFYTCLMSFYCFNICFVYMSCSNLHCFNLFAYFFSFEHNSICLLSYFIVLYYDYK